MNKLILAASLIFISSNAAHADMGDAYKATCRITKRATKNVKAGRGTGVVWKETKNFYWILTAGHIPEEKGTVEVEFFHSGKPSHVMKGDVWHINYHGSLKIDGVKAKGPVESDLALIRLPRSELKDYPPPTCMPLAKRGRIIGDETVISVGCPKGGWPTAWVGKAHGYRNQFTFYFMPHPLSGRSGSAIFNKEGTEILGIIVREKGLALSLDQIYKDFDTWTGREFILGPKKFEHAEPEMIELEMNPVAERIKPVIDIPYDAHPEWYGRPGWEERGPEFRRWLAPSVRVTAINGGGGSGTICYYDGEWAYVISCGHLYPRGRRNREQLERNPIQKKIRVYYHNDKELEEPKDYIAETLCYVWEDYLYDVSLLRFKPDWKPWVIPIAPKDYEMKVGEYYHSCGCDGLRPVAHYLVKYARERNVGDISEIITTENGPRGGRSGGGVMTDDHQLLCICSRGGGGYGYWSSLKQIHKFLKANDFEWLLVEPAQLIPIKDHNNPQGKYPPNYIPIPR